MAQARAEEDAGTGTSTKRRALSLHIGIDRVDPDAYEGWDGPLAACEHDARDMAGIARAQGIAPQLLLTNEATRPRVVAALRSAARRLGKGDYFLLTYSGHGGQVPDTSADEADRADETWCLHDGQLIDDELHAELAGFVAGVRVLVVSDSCHSGTITRDRDPPLPAPGAPRPRLLPPSVARRVHAAHRREHERLPRGRPRIAAAVVLVSGCQDDQLSYDGERNGAFTGQLRAVWQDGAFAGSHRDFHTSIRNGMPAEQSPNLDTMGPVARFLKQRPFTV